MKKQTLFKVMTLIMVFCIGQNLWATQYCGEVLTSGDKSVTITCTLVSDGNYQMIVEGEGAIGFGGTFCHVYAAENPEVGIATDIRTVTTVDGSTLTCNLASVKVPSFYTPLYVMMPGEVNFGSLPTDLEWGVCGVVTPDAVAPVMGTATLESKTYNSAIIAVTATDKDDDNANTQVSTFIVSDSSNGITNVEYTASAGKITVTGLSEETTYNLSIKAKDKAGNTSANSTTVAAFTTLENLTEPKVAAPAPATTYPANQVLAIFSDEYTAVTGINYNPAWGQATQQSIVEIAENNTLKYADLNYQGTEFGAINASNMEQIHIDVWAAQDGTIQLFPICQIQTSGEQFKELTLVGGQWNSFDVPVSYYSNLGLNLAGLFQFKIVGTQSIWIDNWYLYTTQAPDADTEAPTGLTVTAAETFHNAVNLKLKATDASGAVTYEITHGTTTMTTQGASGVEITYKVTGLTASTAYTFSVVAKDDSGNASAAATATATTAAAIPAPTASAPTPSATNVISFFSDAYDTNVPFTIGGWGQSTTVSDFAIGDDNIKLLESFNYLGLEFAAQDASAMTHLHIDVWSNDAADFRITPIWVGGELLITKALTAGQWTSIDIPLSEYTGINLANVFQIKMEGSGTIYFDNLYFYNTNGSSIDNADAVSLNIYPNPASDYMILESDSEIAMITIRNLLGQAVKTVSVGAQAATIALDDVTQGNYFVTILTQDGNATTRKLVVR